MSNQEMQFADPDWKPSQQLGTNNNPQEQEVYTPQPINSDYREQSKWGSVPSSLPQQEGYSGLRPYTAPVPGQIQSGNYRQRPYSRRGRGPWFWIILAFIIISLASGGFRSFTGPGPGTVPYKMAQPFMVKPQDFIVTGQPTIVINDPNGNVTVIQGQSNSDVLVQAENRNNFNGDPNDVPVTIGQDVNNANLITATVQDSQSPVDITVRVPQNANLQIKTDTGAINVAGVDGQMTLTTNDGTVNLTIPSGSPLQIDATTNSGKINSDIPGVTPQKNSSGSGAHANGNVGGSSQGQAPKVTITTGSGDIILIVN